jgi:hypothetical protein
MSWPTASRPVCLGVKRSTRFLLLSDSCEFVDVGRLLWREDGSVVYNCWSWSAQPFSGSSPAWLYFPVSDSRLPQPGGPGLSVFMSPSDRVPSYTPRHLVPFSSPPTTRRATMEVLEPASTRGSGRTESESESESELLHVWWFTVNQFVLASSPSTLTTFPLCNADSIEEFNNSSTVILLQNAQVKIQWYPFRDEANRHVEEVNPIAQEKEQLFVSNCTVFWVTAPWNSGLKTHKNVLFIVAALNTSNPTTRLFSAWN